MGRWYVASASVLYCVKMLVEAMGGEIGLTSTVDAGRPSPCGYLLLRKVRSRSGRTRRATEAADLRSSGADTLGPAILLLVENLPQVPYGSKFLE